VSIGNSDGSTRERKRTVLEKVQMLNAAGQKLQPQYGEKGIPSEVLCENAAQLGGYVAKHLRPADYCYNSINSDRSSFVHHIFERLEDDKVNCYRYLGAYFPYDGAVFWKPKSKGEEKRRVGQWVLGVPSLDEDPRRPKKHREQ
jgi:hypothetical protein